MEATVSEIHEYPVRPEAYADPLFSTIESDRRVMEHLLRASWLKRASQHEALSSMVASGSGRLLAEPREVRVYRERGVPMMKVPDRCRKVRRCGVRSGAIRRVIERWREVFEWWEDGGGRDLDVYRVELSCGTIVDLARNRSVADGEPGRWLLVGISD